MPYTKPARKRIPEAGGANPNLGILLLVRVGGLASPVLHYSDNPGDTPSPKLEVVALGEGQRVRKSREGEVEKRGGEQKGQGREGGSNVEGGGIEGESR